MNQTKWLIIAATACLLAANICPASKPDSRIEAAFGNFKKGKNIELNGETTPLSLRAILTDKKHTIPQALYAIQEIRGGGMKATGKELRELLAMHRKKTFKAIYPEHWRFIKAIDYEQRLCDEIELLILSEEEK